MIRSAMICVRKALSCPIFIVLILSFNALSQNPIVTENALPGNPISEWGVPDFRDNRIAGFATKMSLNRGQTVRFKINVQSGATYTLRIYRLGYYGGNGARLMANLGTLTGTIQPGGIYNSSTGHLDCSNWSESATWAIPSSAVSGFYIAKLERTGGGSNHIAFIVRNDASTSDLYVQFPDATWQAYNGYGGNSMYDGTTSWPAGHAVKVSYNRPFFPYNSLFNTDGREADWYMNAEYPMIRWLERNGYDVTYTSCNDVSNNGSRLLNHEVFVALGHDEYWSKEHRENVEAARNAGVHIAFFTGNEVYWKTRWENNDGTEDRTLVCYKEGFLGDGTLGERTCGTKCDPSPEWTGLWRTGGNYDAGQPENSLVGQISWVENPAEIGVPAFYKNLRFWRNTSVANLTSGQTAFLGENTLGYEWDYEQPVYASSYPAGRITMSSRTINNLTHKLSLYRHSSGALVFGAGTVQWSWGLDGQHWGGSTTTSPEMQQATVNLFADMGVQPGTLQAGLTGASQSSDLTAPTSTITSPSNGASFSSGATINFSGSANDGGGGVVASVEISMDGGSTWTPATITSIASSTSWTYTWSAGPNGTYNIQTRGIDDSGNKGNPGSGINITVGVGGGDFDPPTVSSVSPANGATGVSVNTPVIANFSEAISGASVTSSTYQLRAGSNLVNALVSTSGSQITLSPAAALSPSTTYTVTITGGSSGVEDLAGNVLVNNYSWTFTTSGGGGGGGSVTLFLPSSAPAELANDEQGIALGMRFRTTQNGFINGIRYYKGEGTTGTHTGHLWTNAGTQLAQATFTNETASGWQQVLFSSPVAVTAGVTYVASYFSPSGDYCATKPFFTQAVVNGPLRGLADGEDGPNGLYRYTATTAFPNSSFQSSNYWVDVVFTASGGGTLPGITLQPSSQTVCAGNNVSFTSAANGSPTPTVQWQESTNGTSWTNISGATNSTLSVSATTALDNRQYRAVWTNSGGSVNSNSATLTVDAIPAAPSVSAVNNCGSSTLTAGSFTGSLLWSTGATSTSITVTTAGTYTVTQAVNGCTSSPGSGVAAPLNANVSAPTVTVVNNCGSSTLTAGSFTGSLLWSTGATSTSITVTTAGTYSVTQTVNGCTSLAGSGVAAPKPIPALNSSLTGTATSGVSYSYVPSSNVSGTTFNWTRATVTGISNAAANGTGNITETLINTTSSPVNVTYVYTLTANGCTNTQNVVITVNSVNPTPVANCTINNTSLTSNFNGTAIPAGRYIWFNSSLDPGSLGTGTDPVTMNITNGVISFTANNVQYNLSVPNARIRFDASVTSASTQFINNVWETVVPRSYSSDVFMGGLSYLVPVNFPGNFMNVNWTTNISIDKEGISVGWRWAAAVYTSFADHPGLNVKPINGSTQNPYPNLDRASTPENFKSFVVDGAKGTGGTNYTGSFSVVNTATCTIGPEQPAAPIVTVVNNCGNSVLTAGSFTGSLLWSNGATTPSITVTEGGIYTVTQTVNGSTSAPGSGTAAPLNANVPSPTVSVVNNCGSSTLTAGSFTGSLLWNTGATTPSITVTAAGTYSVTQTVNGCTSSPGSGIAAPLNANVSVPTVTVVNNCGSSTLTAGSFTGSLLWSTGATSTSITVTSAGTYTVTQAVNGCTSSPGSGVAAPLNANVSAPTVTVVNNCGSSTLTAGSFTGSLLWSTGATSTSITVTTAGTYTVTQTVNGCTSLAGSGIAAPKPIPALNSSLTGTATSGVSFSYVPSSNVSGTTFNWTRAAVTGISNAAANGTGNITETLINTTSSPVNVTYVYTLTANGCTNTQNVVITVNSVNPTPVANCTINNTSLTSNFNGTAIPAGRYIWFNSSLDPGSLGTGTGPVTMNITNGVISFTANNVQYNLSVPNARIRFDASVTSASTQFINNVWETVVPRSYSSDVFMGGLSYLVPVNFPGNFMNVNWTTNISIDKEGISVGWRWAAAVYTSFADHPGLNVKPINGSTQNPYPNLDRASTPENFKSFVVDGAKGTGGTNYTGSFSVVNTATCTIGPEQPAAPIVTVVNNCGNSVLTAGSFTGSLLWSNGATTPSITVTEGGIYTVTQTVNGSTSAPGSGTAAPLNANVPSPTVSVVNNCGSSTLTAGSFTGSLLWNTGATTPSITVTAAGTYSVTQTVNGCTSSPGSGIAAPLNANVSVPTVTVVNNCGSSTLTAGSFTGSLLWSTGATTASIIVTTAGTYTVTQAVNGCTSSPGSGVAAPVNANVSAPTVTVVDNCGSSTLTAGSFTGSLLWSTGATAASITVTTAGTYTVTQTLNGCTSSPGSGVAAPLNANVSAPTVTVVNNCGSSTLTAESFTGSLLWSTGATTPSITVTAAGTYTVRQTVNGCTSSPGSGVAAPLNANVSAPTVTVVNNCGSSTLTAGSFTGSLLWSTGATTPSITVTAAGTYTVTQTVSGCTSSPGSGVAAPLNANVPAPSVTVVNNCGSSTLTAGSFTGSLLWSTGATTASINVTAAGTYTVTQTVGGCTSSPGSGVAAPLTSNVPAPTVTVVNTCGSSTLTAGSFTGSLLWSTGATTASINVTAAGTYTVTQTVNGCTSSPGSVVAAPINSNVPAPTVTVTNNCNNSVLTAGSFTGSLLWSTGATTASITVTTGGAYTVTQTVNGCSSPAATGTAAPKPTPALTSNLTATATSGTSFTYTPTSSVAATTFTWTRAAVTGISNAAGSGIGAITETLTDTTTSPVNVTYVYTLTAAGCTSTQNVVVTVNPALPVNCTINGNSLVADFNNDAIPAGRYIWFNSSLDPGSLGTDTTTVVMDITNTFITFTANGVPYVLNVPDGRIRFDAAVSSASTQFVNGRWETVVPRSFTSYVFMNGLSFLVPVNFPGNIANVRWTASVKIDRANTSINWRWSAAVYTTFAGHSGINVKPINGNSQNPYPNSDRAGTPENFKSSLVDGARGNGGSNYTGNYVNSGSITCSTVGTRSGAEPLITKQTIADRFRDLAVEKLVETRELDAQVMPNPSSTYFNLAIKGSNDTPVTIKIMDIFGRVVERHDRIAANTILKVGSKWTHGSYYAEVIQGDQRKIIKIIKAR